MIISRRFNGPPESGNGGYCAGRFAALVDGPAVVTLRRPPPLDTPLRATRGSAGFRVYAGEQVVADALAAHGPAPVPVPPVALTEALDASEEYGGLVDHPFRTCYVCGVDRAEGDGLLIFAGPLPDGRSAAPWVVPDDVAVETMWAALDCPGGWAIGGVGRPYVLGQIAAVVSALPEPGEICLVVGECDRVEGRKAATRSTIYSLKSEVMATAEATWIAV
ncbi:MAG TPA: hypothetical protein VFM54_16830 [Micromonosporaceae bacterium]|nr:hypothetical protein [Micromonosporaceae bacterium]